jgi:hypothetical protein
VTASQQSIGMAECTHPTGDYRSRGFCGSIFRAVEEKSSSIATSEPTTYASSFHFSFLNPILFCPQQNNRDTRAVRLRPATSGVTRWLANPISIHNVVNVRTPFGNYGDEFSQASSILIHQPIIYPRTRNPKFRSIGSWHQTSTASPSQTGTPSGIKHSRCRALYTCFQYIDEIL